MGKRFASVFLVGASTLSIGLPSAGFAQSEARNARQGRVTFNVPAGPLKAALDAWAAQSRRQIIYAADDVADARTVGFKGAAQPDSALFVILRSTGLNAQVDPSGAVAITRMKRDVSEVDATPDILVTGQKDWSLNLGIERTRDDSQPFIVMTAEDIKRSGAPDLETFLRNQLTVNSTAGTSRQAGLDGGDPFNDRVNRGLSQVNLRGLGARETLILVDGRRQPGVNLGNGTFGQPQITGIPLASIERIEVLASSASAIYGSGASGGAINIVLKRSYNGGELTATYGNTTDFAAGEGRIDGAYSKTLEGGRTNINLSGSWRKSKPLLYADRISIRNDNIAETLRLTGSTGLSPFAFQPDVGATPNFRAANGQPLRLKPEFGGTLLGSAIGNVPENYRGLAQDGVAPLLANIGQYNIDPPAGVQAGGLQAPLIYGTEMASGLLSVRRKMNDWMTLYAQGQLSHTTSATIITRGLRSSTLAANAPNNPFTTAINISIPSQGTSVFLKSRLTQWSAVGGAIFKLPYGWQANVDLTYSRSRYVLPDQPAGVTTSFFNRVQNGTIDILRDVAVSPVPYEFVEGFAFRNTPLISTNLLTSLRTSGPLPVKLPGGQVQMTVNVERSADRLGGGIQSTGLFNTVGYRQPGSYTQTSGYGEIVFPLVSPNNKVPFVDLFDIRISARHERYNAFGAQDPVTCYTGFNTPPPADIYDRCPPPGYVDDRVRSGRSHTDPMVSFRWKPVEDVMFRGSYGTGYLPPTLAQLNKLTARSTITLFDSARGYEPVGTPDEFGDPSVLLTSGGNPDVEPEKATTYTAGIVFTPRFVPNLRVSADWTRIRKTDNFFDPSLFASAGFAFAGPDNPGQPQLDFAQFVALYPERVVRGPASDGFAVGPITALDLSLANYVGSQVEAVDFALDYSHDLFGGRLDLSGTATWNRQLRVETYPGVVTEFAGTGGGIASIGGGINNALKWRANGTVRWSTDTLMIGVQTLFFDRYYFLPDRSVNIQQGSAFVPAQVYNNLLFSYNIDPGIAIRGTINNVFDETPPRDVTVRPLFYSRFGDPLGRNFLLSVSKSF